MCCDSVLKQLHVISTYSSVHGSVYNAGHSFKLLLMIHVYVIYLLILAYVIEFILVNVILFLDVD